MHNSSRSAWKFLLIALALVYGGVASADFVLFRFSPNSKSGIVLEGDVEIGRAHV